MTIRELFVGLGFEVDKNSERKAEQGIENLKAKASKLLGAIGIGISVAGITSAIKDCVALSSEVEEMENKFNVVFGNIADDVDAWAQRYSDAIGRNKNDIKTYLADQQNLLVGFGMTREAGAELSEQITSLALDLASFGNMDEATAVQAMSKAVMGQAESAKTLGAVLNESTRQQAMLAMGLSGTYDSLDQLTKMQVNYQAILLQSSDAVGDCERSMGSYASTLKSFQSKLKEIKTLVGQFFMPTIQKVLRFGAQGLTTVRDLIQRFNDFANKIGGAERIIGLFATTFGLAFAAQKISKVGQLITFFKNLDKAALGARLKMLAIVAIIALIVLAVDDFINFMKGNDSVIGAVLEKAGIDTEAARQTIIQAWQTVKTFLLGVWDKIKDGLAQAWTAIKAAAQAIFGALSAWWAENGEQVLAAFSRIWEGIKTLCVTLWNALSGAAKRIFSALKAFWDQWGSTIISVFSTIWNTLIALIQPFLDALAAIIDFLASVFTGDWQGAWQAVKDFAVAIWTGLVTAINGYFEIIRTVWSAVVDFFAGIFQNVRDAIAEKIASIKETIVSGFQAAIDWITSLPAQALQWGADIIQGIVDGIKGAVSKVGDAVKGVADKIKSFLGFSEPETGPLSNFHTFMPDMISLMANGIQKGKSVVQKALEDLTGGMSDEVNGFDPNADPTNRTPDDVPDVDTGDDPTGPKPKGGGGNVIDKLMGAASRLFTDMSTLTQSAVASPATVQAAAGGDVSRSITQNVNIENTFNGDRAGQQKSAAAMDKAADDSTEALARALQYAR